MNEERFWARGAGGESGAHSPSLASVVRLADYFNVTVDFLLGRDGKVIFVMK